MKKLPFVLAAVLLLTCTFVGCGSQEPDVSEPDQSDVSEPVQSDVSDPGQLTGGWTVDSAAAGSVPDEVKTAFDKALEMNVGASYEPLAYLGSQVVAGSNYAILAKATRATADPESELKVVVIYADPDGNAETTNITDFSITDYTDEKESAPAEELAGGWTVSTADAAVLTGDAKAAFDKALEDYTGKTFEPLALIGTQVVAGTNYAFICRGTSVTAEPVSELDVVIVYADLEGNASVLNVAQVDFAEITAKPVEPDE